MNHNNYLHRSFETSCNSSSSNHLKSKKQIGCNDGSSKDEEAPKKEEPIYEWKRIKEGDNNPAGNKGRPGKRIHNTDGEKPKDYSFMIAELIPHERHITLVSSGEKSDS